MKYYLDLFTAETWKEFQEAGSNVSGFSSKNYKLLASIKSGDILICYLTGAMRWVGALEVIRTSSDKRPIWKSQVFPARFDVKPLIVLQPEFGLPMESLEQRVSFYSSAAEKGKFHGFVRMSPNRFQHSSDAETIMTELRQLAAKPIRRSIDPKKLAYMPKFKAEIKRGSKSIPVLVTIPSPDLDASDTATQLAPSAEWTKHTEIQYQLLTLGVELGFEVWVARNDRNKTFNGSKFSDLETLVDKLPTQFNEATTNTIEFIDVLWMKGKSIIAAFEVESTTSVYSGLLRMSDLLALQPNLDIKLYIVAPEARHDKVEQEILRPTFEFREKPLSKTCGFITFEELLDKVEVVRNAGLVTSLKPEFLDQLAEYFSAEEEE